VVYLKKVLFVCVENAGRSQMAEAFARKYVGDKYQFLSAGNIPAPQVHPVVVEAMKERSIDISAAKPKLITAKMTNEVDLVVTMGCSSNGICPGLFFVPTMDWPLEDPKGKTLEKVREIRDDIERRVKELVANLSA
jgi:arsenate reductase